MRLSAGGIFSSKKRIDHGFARMVTDVDVMGSKKFIGLLFVYGAMLCFCGFALAGFGHGTYFLIGLAGAPFSILGPLAAILASLAQWGLLVSAQRRFRLHQRFVVVFLVLHY